MNQKPNINVETLRPFARFCMTIGELPSSYLMSMTYQEQLTWLCNYLEKTVIPTVNNNAEAVNELQNLYDELRNYVNNYFDNLDLQDEVNNKLDKMAEDGTLARIMQQYIMPYFNSFTNEVNTNINQQNTKINEIETKVNNAVSGSPLVANTLSEMTNTTRIYVLTTDGHWYWYDGTRWQDGGVYQSTGISQTDPVIEELNAKIDLISGRSSNLLNEEDIVVDKTHRERFIPLSEYNLEGNKTYTLSFRTKDVIPSTSNNNNLVIRYRMTNQSGQSIQFDTQQIEEGLFKFTFTPIDVLYSFAFVISNSVSDGTSLTITDIMLSESENYIPYVPYITAYDGEARNEIEQLKQDISLTYRVESYEELLDAIDNAGVISLINNIKIDSRIYINNKNLHILGNGFTITADDDITDYIIAIANGTIKIENLKFEGSNSIDYLLVGTSNSKVYVNDCTFHYSHDSIIKIANNGIMYINNCDIGYSYANDGISPQGTSNVYITNCKVHDCYDEGISSHNSSYCEVYNTESYNNGYIIGTKNKGATSSFGGIHLGGGKMGIVKDCYSHDNRTYGIALINFQDSTQIDFENCTDNIVKNNGGAGIFCTGARRLILGYNTIINNREAIHFGLDTTYTPTIDLVASAGIVNKNTLYGNTNNNIIIDSGADDGIIIIQ